MIRGDVYTFVVRWVGLALQFRILSIFFRHPHLDRDLARGETPLF